MGKLNISSYEIQNDDLDIGGEVGISALDHSLEPGLTPPNISTAVRSFVSHKIRLSSLQKKIVTIKVKTKYCGRIQNILPSVHLAALPL